MWSKTLLRHGADGGKVNRQTWNRVAKINAQNLPSKMAYATLVT